MPAWTGQASVRYRWPLHVIESAGHLVVAERPEAFLEALRAALGNR
jgi:pimeloyl-ACP methyl ester carboxylesterase